MRDLVCFVCVCVCVFTYFSVIFAIVLHFAIVSFRICRDFRCTRNAIIVWRRCMLDKSRATCRPVRCPAKRPRKLPPHLLDSRLPCFSLTNHCTRCVIHHFSLLADQPRNEYRLKENDAAAVASATGGSPTIQSVLAFVRQLKATIDSTLDGTRAMNRDRLDVVTTHCGSFCRCVCCCCCVDLVATEFLRSLHDFSKARITSAPWNSSG